MADRTAEVERHGLNYVMEFDHVVQVHADGSVTDDVPNVRAAWAPEMTGDSATGNAELDGDGWSIMSDGYTGQQGGGHVMHDSESIGGRLARDILATPGYYVAVMCTWSNDGCPVPNCAFDDCNLCDEDTVEGWAVAYRESL